MATRAYWRTYNLLREQVIGGHFAAGQKLPAERHLSKQFGVSRITIRHAMRLLREQGLVESFPGRGTFVRTIHPKKLPILNYDFAASMREQAPNLQRRLLSKRHVVPPAHIRQDLSLLKSEKCLLAQRLDLLDEEPLTYDRAYIPLDLADSLDDHILARIDFLDEWLARTGRTMSHGVESIEAIEADEEAARRLCVTMGTPLLLATDTVYTQDGRALAVFESLYRGDRFKLVSTNTGGPKNVTTAR